MNKKILAFAVVIIASLLVSYPIHQRYAANKAIKQQEEARILQEQEALAQKEEEARILREKDLARKNKALAQLDKEIELQLKSQSIPKNKALAALYIDDNDLISDPRKKVEYKCFFVRNGNVGGFHSGRVPYNTPWTGILYVYDSEELERKIVIDAGPQYEYITKDVKLTPGQVTNLGYIKLEKVSEKPVASINGVIKGEDGLALENAKVSSQTNSTVTDSDGNYSIDVFRTGECRLRITKSGYVSSRKTVRVEDKGDSLDKDITLPIPRKVTIRYMIVPREIDDFTSPKAAGGTITLLVNKEYTHLPEKQIKSEDFKKFIDKANLRFNFRSGKFMLRTGYSSVLTELIQHPGEKFEDIKTVGTLDRKTSNYVDMKQGDILLLDGAKQSDYKVKILFEKITRVLP